MPTRHAIAFAIEPGSEDRVTEILTGYARPQTEIDDETRLLRTTVFLHGTWLVRVMDIEGAFGKVMAHLAVQPEVQEVERQLNEHLVEPRDLTNPDAARAFFMHSMMKELTSRTVPGSEGRTGSRHAIVYPVLPGRGPEVDDIVQQGGDPPQQAGARTALLSTTVFRRRDLVVRMFEIDGSLDEAREHLARATPLLRAGLALRHLLDPSVDLTTEAGLGHFLESQAMTLVTDRLAGAPAAHDRASVVR